LRRFRLPELKVDLHNSDWILNVEIRDSVYLYGPEIPAPGGLPLGCSGKGLLLLSGGIDSPVAGYLMGKRGLKMDAVYFHTPPFTSQRVQDKVERLTDILSAYLSGITLYVVPFTDAQLRIKERAHREKATLLMRACMIKIAEKIACQMQLYGYRR
jgi:thiamine biosynthesis protein ThiI